MSYQRQDECHLRFGPGRGMMWLREGGTASHPSANKLLDRGATNLPHHGPKTGTGMKERLTNAMLRFYIHRLWEIIGDAVNWVRHR